MSVIHTQQTGQPFVKSSKAERMVDTNSLTPHQKQIVWLGMKSTDPVMADMLKTDTNINALKQTLNASVRFSVDDFNRYLNAGLKIIEERK